jgi:hypothetical protein
VPIVTSSTPIPTPARKRQKFSPKAVSWTAMTTLAATYHRSDPVNTARRPNRSARKPQAMVPMNMPANSAAMNPAMPLVPNRPGVDGDSTPLRTMPGATYAV